jgi:hypothetical protein
LAISRNHARGNFFRHLLSACINLFIRFFGEGIFIFLKLVFHLLQ